jgi:hypothetical protein
MQSSCFEKNYSPMQPRISPMACMDLIRFFIISYLQNCVWLFLQIADDSQHLADGLHGLGQILVHYIYPPK